MMDNQDCRERASRHTHSKGAIKQITQTWSVMGEAFDLESRYKVIDYLGAGAYGVVCAAKDSTENNVVAIKKCKKIFQSRTLAKRTLRELRLLRLFDHENVVKIKCVLKPLDAESFSEIYVVFEIMETDLAQIIRSPQTLKDQHVQYFTYQLLLALKYLHAANIVHRDLKPRNLLVNGDCCLKVADFGLARVYNDSNDSKILAMTEYVTTRWYRAPEVLVGWHRYTSAVDMWAVGCIVAELIGRMPLFPGADSMKQLDLLCRFSGKPSDEFIRQSRKASCRQYLNELPAHIKATDVRNLYPGANPQALDLVKRLLDFNPVTRITAEEALQHPYIQPMLLRNPTTKTEPVLRFSDSEFLFEGQKASVEDLRFELLREVSSYFPKPVIAAARRGAVVVVDVEEDGIASVTTVEKENAVAVTAVSGESAGVASSVLKDKRSLVQSQSVSDAEVSAVTGTVCVAAAATALTGTHAEVPSSKSNSGKQDEPIRGSKRGRLDIPGAANTVLKERVTSSSSSVASADVSVVSERMKALSTSATAVEDRPANMRTVTPAQSEENATDAVPQYVRRGAKRASVAAERPSTVTAADAVAAVSGLDDVADEGDVVVGEWTASEVKEVEAKRCPATVSETESAVDNLNAAHTTRLPISKGTSVDKVNDSNFSRGSNSLYSCLGRENSGDNADERSSAAIEDKDDGEGGICNFATVGSRTTRRGRAKRPLLSSSLIAQKQEQCIIA